MFYRSYTPARPLRDFVDHLWLYSDTPLHFKERILPSGTIEMVINLRDDELRIDDPAQPGCCHRFSGALVSGAYGGYFTIDAAQQESIVGVHFKPGGAFPFFGPPAGELADQHIDLETLWGPTAVTLRERLCAALDPADRFRLLEEALTGHLFRELEHHGAVPIALDAFEDPDAGPTVRDVARRVGLSQRRFIEIFAAEVGMTPKRFCRVRRFQRVLARIRGAGTPDWARLSIDCGYYDQSHLIRDFLAFSGLNPSDYLRQGVERVKNNHMPLTRAESIFSNTGAAQV